MGEAELLSDAAVQRYRESSLGGKSPLSLREKRGNESIKSSRVSSYSSISRLGDTRCLLVPGKMVETREESLFRNSDDQSLA